MQHTKGLIVTVYLFSLSHVGALSSLFPGGNIHSATQRRGFLDFHPEHFHFQACNKDIDLWHIYEHELFQETESGCFCKSVCSLYMLLVSQLLCVTFKSPNLFLGYFLSPSMNCLPFSCPITLIACYLCVIVCSIKICFLSHFLCSTFIFFIIVLFRVSSVVRQTVHFPVTAQVSVNKSPRPLPTMVSAPQGSVFYWCPLSLTNIKFKQESTLSVTEAIQHSLFFTFLFLL